MIVEQTPTFYRHVKKLTSSQKKSLDEAVRALIEDPYKGDLKVGDLASVRVYKFHIKNHPLLLAYHFNKNESKLTLLALGAHENFYRDLKKSL